MIEKRTEGGGDRPVDSATQVPPSILIVNDDRSQITVLHQLLEPLDIEVESVESGAAALMALKRRDFSAILLDIEPGGIDGLRTAELVRQQPASRETPILFISASATDDAAQERAYSLGAIDFLFGPLRPALLRAKVAALVRLSRAGRAASSANAAKSEFMSLAAHELRAPLGVIGGYVAMLADGSLGPPLEAWRGPLAIVAAKVAEIDALVADLLLAARLEAGEIPLSIESINLGSAAQRAVSRAEPRLELRGGEIWYEESGNPTFAYCDPTQLAHILDNLINNAINYSSGPPRVTVSVMGASLPTIAVSDEGAGIPNEARHQIFDRMTRLQHRGLENVPGTGLGLYLSRGLARRQGGDLVLATSEVGAGSRFELTLKPAEKSVVGGNHVSHRRSESALINESVVNRLSHELGGPLAVIRGYLSLWLDGTLDPRPWSSSEEITERFGLVQGLADQVRVLVGSIGPHGLAGGDLQQWVTKALWEMAPPIADLLEWFQTRDRDQAHQMSFASAHAALVCERNAILLQALASQLAAVQRVHGDEPTPMESIDLSAWLRQAIHELAPAVTCFGHTVSLSLSTRSVAIQGNRALLSIALLQLLDNAQKFSPSGSPILVTGFASNSAAGFEVEDRGPGLPRNFELRAFGRIDHSVGFASPGMGLGLYTAGKVAELHNGTLTFRSIERVGTSFRVQMLI